jgi:hypothetical protein
LDFRCETMGHHLLDSVMSALPATGIFRHSKRVHILHPYAPTQDFKVWSIAIVLANAELQLEKVAQSSPPKDVNGNNSAENCDKKGHP